MLYLTKSWFCPKVTFFQAERCNMQCSTSASAAGSMEVALLPLPQGIFFTNSSLLRNVSLWSSRKLLHGFGFLFDEILWISISHLLCSSITGNMRYLSWSSVSCGHFQELFEKMMEECRMFGLRQREGRTGRKTSFHNEDFSADSGNLNVPYAHWKQSKKKSC